MGGKPFLATAILSWPTDTLPLEMAAEVIQGARSVCQSLEVSLAGGHSVKGQEPMFGLSVNGLVNRSHIKRNNTVSKGDLIYLTKPLGLGILASVHKKNKLSESEYKEMIDTMLMPNSIGAHLGTFDFVTAMTDVTGFGLVGHLNEMVMGKMVSAIIDYQNVPKLQSAESYMNQFIYPDNTTNNYNAVKEVVQFLGGTEFLMLCDPQTSGGLLISIKLSQQKEFESVLIQHNQMAVCIGKIVEKTNQYSIIFN
jgi:selenide, water dikinase